MTTALRLIDDLVQLVSAGPFVRRVLEHVPAVTADALLRAALAGADDAALRVVAGAATYETKYGVSSVGRLDFLDLRLLVRDARIRLGELDREVAALTQTRDRLAELLSSAAGANPP